MEINFMICADFANVFHNYKTDVIVTEDKVYIHFENEYKANEFLSELCDSDALYETTISYDKTEATIILYMI
jgi:hypothetical protein